MEQFNLAKWLQDKSRKVVTRRGNPVRIICTDRKHGEDDLPIVFLEEKKGGEFLLTCRNDGRCDNYDTQYDLFFADEEEELTEFEKRFTELIRLWISGNTNPEENIIQARCDAKELIDLARKEILEEFKCREELFYKNGFEKGKEDTLKDLPKWKNVSGKNGAGTKDYKIVGYYLVKGNYAIYLEDLEKLPKE